LRTSQTQSDWARLFRIAYALIRQVNSEQQLIDHWTFGGGTALMLQIGHRESHDVDIFLENPQHLLLLDPEKRDFQWDIEPSASSSDGARFLKLSFDRIGEIDFIVASALTALPTVPDTVEGEAVLLDSVPEIITKKIHFRGASISPRDVFDIAAAGEEHEASVVGELSSYRNDVAQTLAAMEKLKPDFVNKTIAQLIIKDRYAELAKAALDRAKQILRSV
jgi:Nucleotidyl transferase AbiEii toxin, Type IV TA system